jgi:hypothetical protein
MLSAQDFAVSASGKAYLNAAKRTKSNTATVKVRPLVSMVRDIRRSILKTVQLS